MKKTAFSLLLAVSSPFMLWAQGIKFEEGTFTEALAKAKKENKIVFVDVYTTWCGPCKKMAKEFFPTKEAGDKYNTAFVNYKIDAEKGEGIQVAQKYNVSGYPTSLYLKPDGSVVYTSMGISDLDGFLHNADVAIEEYKDPYDWDWYAVSFKKGSESKEFLMQYLQKAKRLGKENDAALDKYVTKYVNTKKPADNDLIYLAENIQTIDNKAYAVLADNTDKINAMKSKEIPDFFNNFTSTLLVPTAEKLGKENNVARFDALVRPVVERSSKTPDADMMFYREYFYKAKGDKAALKKFSLEKGQFLSNRTAEAYAHDDEVKKGETIASMKYQMIAANVPAEQQQAQIARVIEQNPMINNMVSFNAANDLNGLAWNIYESKDQTQYKTALQWSKRSVELIGNSNPSMRAACMDTYAHLLFANGDKEEAIKQETAAIELLKTAEATEGLEEMEEVLNNMKAGKL